jgi:hypothetical protein
MYKLVRILAQENAWVRRVLWAAGIVVVLAVLWAVRPRSPQVTVARYLESLRAGDCDKAWRLVSDQRRGLMDGMASFDSFGSNVCQPVASSYDKLYYEPWDGEKLDVLGGRADLRFCACARPVARTRRMCAVHEAVLVREHLRWKILFLPIGPWDKEACRWERQKPEALISPESRHKMPGPGQ